MGKAVMETPQSHQGETVAFNYSLQGDLKSIEARGQWLLKLGKKDTEWKSCRYL